MLHRPSMLDLEQASLQLHLLCSWQQLQACHDVVRSLRLCGNGRLTGSAQDLLLRRCLSSPLTAVFPCAQDYLGRLLKAVVVAADADGEEVAEGLVDLYTACLLAPGGGCALPAAARLPALPAPPPGWCYKLFAYAPLLQPAATTLDCLAQIESQLAVEGPTAQGQQPGGQEERECSRALAAAAPVVVTAAAAEEVDGGNSHGGGSVWGGEDVGRLQGGEGSINAAPGCLPALVCSGRGQAHGYSGGGSSGLVALRVSRNLFEGGTGCHEWEAGFFLAELVLSNPALFAGRACLELGSGCGMVGVALHRVGAASLACTDGDTQSVFNCRYNLQLNGVPLRGPAVAPAPCGRLCFSGQQQWQQQKDIQGEDGAGAAGTGGAGGAVAAAGAGADCLELRWEAGAGGLAPDVVVGADLLYDPHVVPTLLALVKDLLQAGSARQEERQRRQQGAEPQQGVPHSRAGPPVALIATTLRNAATLALFVAAAEADVELVLEDVTPAEGGECLLGAGEGAVGAGPVRFLHLPALDDARGRVVLHRLTLAAENGVF